MKWETGKQTSVPEDMRAFLERDTDGMWWVYKTGPDGALLENFATYAGQAESRPKLLLSCSTRPTSDWHPWRRAVFFWYL